MWITQLTPETATHKCQLTESWPTHHARHSIALSLGERDRGGVILSAHTLWGPRYNVAGCVSSNECFQLMWSSENSGWSKGCIADYSIDLFFLQIPFQSRWPFYIYCSRVTAARMMSFPGASVMLSHILKLVSQSLFVIRTLKHWSRNCCKKIWLWWNILWYLLFSFMDPPCSSFSYKIDTFQNSAHSVIWKNYVFVRFSRHWSHYDWSVFWLFSVNFNCLPVTILIICSHLVGLDHLSYQINAYSFTSDVFVIRVGLVRRSWRSRFRILVARKHHCAYGPTPPLIERQTESEFLDKHVTANIHAYLITFALREYNGPAICILQGGKPAILQSSHFTSQTANATSYCTH